MQRTNLFEAPVGGNLLFSLKDIAYTPVVPKMNEPFSVTGKVNLFGIPFLAPVWVIVTATYPETWWESVIPIIGSPEVRESSMVVGSDFEITFKKGFLREGEFDLAVRVYPGPTFPLDSIVFPPAPAFATEETTFMVAGEVPPAGFQHLRILSYGKPDGKPDGTPVTPSGVLELEVGDICRVNFSFEHRGDAETGKFHAAIWVWQLLDPHDEKIANEKTFSVPSSIDWETFEDYYVDIPITSAIGPGSYGLYGKIVDIPGADIFSSYLEDVITITGVPVEGVFENLRIISYETDLPIGGICHVATKFEYQGPILTRNLYAAIGNNGAGGFDEICKGQKSKTVGPDDTPKTYEVEVAIPITSAIDPAGSPYDLYAKVCHGVACMLVDAESEHLQNIITIIGGYAGSIISKWINKAPEGSKIPIPTEVKVDNNTFEVGIRYKNYSGRTVTGGCKVEVRDPGGILRASPPVDWTGMSDNEELSKEYNICHVDKPGNWTVHIDFLMDSTVVDDYDGLLFTAVEEVVPPTVDFSLSKPSASPSHVDPGDSVTIRCPITSLCTESQAITVKAKIYEGSALPGHGDKLDELSKNTTISPGQTKDVTFYHTAIGTDAERRDVEVEVYVGGTLIVQDEWDDIYYVSVAAPPPPEYEGTISKKQLKYNGTIRSIPASSVPQDKSGIVSIWGRNDMTSNQKMGIWWQVKDPDGHVVEEYSRWEAYWTEPGNAQEFIGGRFDLDKAGTYTIDIELFMNPDDQVCVDDYHGTLCTVAGAPPPTAVTFDVMIWGTGGFGHYDKWMCFYYDPAISGFVGDNNWHYPSQDIGFSNVEPGGYLAVFLLENSTMSGQFTSPSFTAVDGGRYQYDLDLGRVSKIG